MRGDEKRGQYMSPSARQDYYLPHYVYDDYRRWEGRWELIDGIAFAMTPAPAIKHQMISQLIAAQLQEVLKECRECRALLPVDWKVNEDTVLQPDNLVVCYEPSGAYLNKAPTLIFEIVSPNSLLRDTELKFAIYEKEGVKYYCIVFPDDRIVKTYGLSNGRYMKIGEFSDETMTFDLTDSCHFSFDFAKIWEDN